MKTSTLDSNSVKTYGCVPRTLLAACIKSGRVDEVGNEGSDGYWIYLRSGFWSPEDETVAIHEYTVSACLCKLRSVESDPRPEGMR
jgi:hypothetical protein